MAPRFGFPPNFEESEQLRQRWQACVERSNRFSGLIRLDLARRTERLNVLLAILDIDLRAKEACETIIKSVSKRINIFGWMAFFCVIAFSLAELLFAWKMEPQKQWFAFVIAGVVFWDWNNALIRANNELKDSIRRIATAVQEAEELFSCRISYQVLGQLFRDEDTDTLADIYRREAEFNVDLFESICSKLEHLDQQTAET